MTVYFIGAGPGASDLITLRGYQRLQQCPVCMFAGSIVPKDLLKFCPDHTRLIDTAPLDLDEIEALYVQTYNQQQDVARLHSGDLSLYSAVAEQIRRLQKHNIPYSLIPGVPAFAAAASVIGQELTIPEVAQSIILTRISGRASAMPPNEKLENFAQTGATLIIHLAIHRINEIVKKLVPYYGLSCPIVIAARIGWPNEIVLRGTLENIIEKLQDCPIERTALIMVGQALNNNQNKESALYNVNYQRRFKNKIKTTD